MLSYVRVVFAMATFSATSHADILYDTTWITDQLAYDSGGPNAHGGHGAFGYISDLRLADDFAVDDAEYPLGVTLTTVAQESLASLGTPPREPFIVRFYADDGGKPSDRAWLKVSVPLRDVTVTEFDDPLFDTFGMRFELDVSRLDIRLAPGVHWINIQPVDTAPDGDWWWQAIDEDTRTGHDPHLWDEGQWHFWQDLGPGTAAMRIEGVAIPAPSAPLLLLALCIPRRRRV